MTSPSEHLIDRLNEQLSAVIDGGLAQHVELDAASPSEMALEGRINAVIDAARAKTIEPSAPSGPRSRRRSSAGSSTRWSRTRR